MVVEISMAEKIRWQLQTASLLDKLLRYAAKNGLPAINWAVQSAGANLSGGCLAYPDAQRREDFRAWKDAITSASGRAPDHDREHACSGGEIRLVCGWEHLPVGLAAGSPRYPAAGVTLTASIWPDEDQD